MKDWLALIARILVSFYLVASSIALIIGYNGVRFYLIINKIKNPQLFIIPAIAIVALSSLFLLSGFKIKIAAISFMLYLIAINAMTPPDFNNPLAMLSFCKNFSILGGILYLTFTDPGRFSMDHFIQRKRNNKTELK